MSQSFVQIYVHIVFHTKDNVKLIREDIENELFSYLGGILKNYKSIPLQIGGTSDHIHILCTLPKTMAPADLAEEVKKSSSKWICWLQPTRRPAATRRATAHVFILSFCQNLRANGSTPKWV